MTTADHWEEYEPWPWQKIVFVDGTKHTRSPPAVMRRPAASGWEYRRLTDEEESDWMGRDIW